MTTGHWPAFWKSMKEFFDIYIIKNSRNKTEIESFNRKFLINYIELAKEYEIPQYSENPSLVLQNSEELLSYCELNTKINYAVYWSSTKNNLKSEIFYTLDGYTIFGLSTENENECNFLFEEMSKFLGCDFGYITIESPAPFSLDSFSNEYLSSLKKKEKYQKYIPNDKFDTRSIEGISIDEIENDRALCYALLCWCQDPNWPVAQKIMELLKKASKKISPCVSTILTFDDDWKYGLRSLL